MEAKEDVEIQNETVTLASISYQNFFRSYPVHSPRLLIDAEIIGALLIFSESSELM